MVWKGWMLWFMWLTESSNLYSQAFAFQIHVSLIANIKLCNIVKVNLRDWNYEEQNIWKIAWNDYIILIDYFFNMRFIIHLTRWQRMRCLQHSVMCLAINLIFNYIFNSLFSCWICGGKDYRKIFYQYIKSILIIRLNASSC